MLVTFHLLLQIYSVAPFIQWPWVAGHYGIYPPLPSAPCWFWPKGGTGRSSGEEGAHPLPLLGEVERVVALLSPGAGFLSVGFSQAFTLFGFHNCFLPCPVEGIMPPWYYQLWDSAPSLIDFPELCPHHENFCKISLNSSVSPLECAKFSVRIPTDPRSLLGSI